MSPTPIHLRCAMCGAEHPEPVVQDADTGLSAQWALLDESGNPSWPVPMPDGTIDYAFRLLMPGEDPSLAVDGLFASEGDSVVCIDCLYELITAPVPSEEETDK